MIHFKPKQVGKGWEGKKIKVIVPFRSNPTRNRKFQKKQQKNSKNLKKPLWLLLKPKQSGKGREREKIKIIVTFRSYPMRNRKFQNNSKKIRKIKKQHYGFISCQNRLEKVEKEKK